MPGGSLYKWSGALVRGVAAVGGPEVYFSERSRACRRRRASRNAWGLSLRFCSLREWCCQFGMFIWIGRYNRVRPDLTEILYAWVDLVREEVEQDSQAISDRKSQRILWVVLDQRNSFETLLANLLDLNVRLPWFTFNSILFVEWTNMEQPANTYPWGMRSRSL